MRQQHAFRPLLPLLSAAALLFGGAAYADCTAPASPELPDGKSATMEQMVTGQKAIKSFQQGNAEYLQCLDKEIKQAEKALKKAKDDAKAAIAKGHDLAVNAYNASVAKEESLAQAFNAQIRAFKEANK